MLTALIILTNTVHIVKTILEDSLLYLFMKYLVSIIYQALRRVLILGWGKVRSIFLSSP